MADEQNTLLRFKGDASGAKDAAKETVAAIRDTEAAVQAQAAAAEQSADREFAAAMEVMNAKREQAEAAGAVAQAEANAAEAIAQSEASIRAQDERTAQAVEAAASREVAAFKRAAEARAQRLYAGARGAGYGEAEAKNVAQTQLAAEIEHMGMSAFTAAHEMETLAEAQRAAGTQGQALARVLSTIDPRLGQLVGTGTAAGKILPSVFTLTAGAAAAAGAAILTVEAAYKSASERAKELADQMQRIKDATVSAEGSAAVELAKQGKAATDDVLGKVTGRTRALKEKGFDESAARQVVAAAVDEQGNLAVDDAELEMLVAGVQTGSISIEGRTAKEKARSFQKAVRTMRKDRSAFATQAQTLQAPRQRMLERANAGDISALTQLAKEQGMSDEEAAAAAKAKSEQIKRGAVGFEETGSALRNMGQGMVEDVANVPVVSGVRKWLGFSTETERRQDAAESLKVPPVTISNYGVQHINAPAPQRQQRYPGGRP